MPRIVILDLEGVQVFKDWGLLRQSCSDRLLDAGFNISAEAYGRAFMDYYRMYSAGRYSSDAQFYKLVLESLGIPFSLSLAKDLHQRYYQSFGIYAQSRDTVLSLKSRYPLMLLSNLVNHWAEFLMDTFRLKGLYQYQIISQSAGYRKPDPLIYELALRLASVKPQECVYLDDKTANVEAGRAMGMDARKVDASQGLTPDLVADLLG